MTPDGAVKLGTIPVDADTGDVLGFDGKKLWRVAGLLRENGKAIFAWLEPHS